MNAPTLIRWSGVMAMLAGVAYMIQTLIGLVSPQAEVFTGVADYLLEAVFIVALLLTILGLVGLRSYQTSREGRSGTVGFWLAILGTFSLLASALATLIAGGTALGLLFFLGLGCAVVGQALLGLAIVRGKGLPRWSGIALTLGLPLSAALAGYGGGMILGLTWLAIGYMLVRPGNTRQAHMDRGDFVIG
jgi:hypothetical protein